MTTSNRPSINIDLSKLLQDVLTRLDTNPQNSIQLLEGNYTHYQLLIITILLTQSSEPIASQVADKLFQICPTPEAMLGIGRRDLERIIQPCGFYRQKAKYIQETSRILLEKYAGELPKTLLELTQLPGIARKTANIFLAEAYNVAEGIVVDTHVHRVANRVGISNGKSAAKVEHDLIQITDPADRIRLSRLFMRHGQKVCYIHEPKCKTCVLSDLCRFHKQTQVD